MGKKKIKKFNMYDFIKSNPTQFNKFIKSDDVVKFIKNIEDYNKILSKRG